MGCWLHRLGRRHVPVLFLLVAERSIGARSSAPCGKKKRKIKHNQTKPSTPFASASRYLGRPGTRGTLLYCGTCPAALLESWWRGGSRIVGLPARKTYSPRPRPVHLPRPCCAFLPATLPHLSGQGRVACGHTASLTDFGFYFAFYLSRTKRAWCPPSHLCLAMSGPAIPPRPPTKPDRRPVIPRRNTNDNAVIF